MTEHINNSVKVCQHKPGEKWKDNCCGNDALAKAKSAEPRIVSQNTDTDISSK